MTDYQQICRALGWLNDPPLDVILKDIKARQIGTQKGAKALALLYSIHYKQNNKTVDGVTPSEAIDLAKFQYDALSARGELK